MKPEDKVKVQQALEFLEIISPQFPPLVYTETDRKRDEASTALRQLLEQPESVQEPMFYWDMDGFFVRPERAKFLNLDVDAMQALYATPQAQPADHSEQDLDMVDHADELTIAYLDGVHTGKRLVKREWVGLTEDEADKIYKDGSTSGEMMRMVEAKLREKNGGAAQPADHSEQHLDMVRALERLLVVQDELCSIDHHGYCQSHYLDNVNSHGGCRVANARALVAKVRGKL
jgi:hypothetical protein